MNSFQETEPSSSPVSVQLRLHASACRSRDSWPRTPGVHHRTGPHAAVKVFPVLSILYFIIYNCFIIYVQHLRFQSASINSGRFLSPRNWFNSLINKVWKCVRAHTLYILGNYKTSLVWTVINYWLLNSFLQFWSFYFIA